MPSFFPKAGFKSLLALALPAAICVLPAPATAAGAHAPQLAETSFAELPQPLPFPYDENAHAGSVIRKATLRARLHHKLLLIDLGGNWCLDCRLLAATMAMPKLAPFITAHYEVVTVDVGRYTKNMDVAPAYGAGPCHGVPMVLIVDPKTRQLVNAGHTTALADARTLSPQALADWLAQWPRPQG